MADQIHFVDANGLRFAYLEEGRGPLVLLLHGFPDTAHSWDHARPRIAARGYYRALRFRPPPLLRTPITVPTVAFAGLDDPNVRPADYAAARRMFQADYAVEELRGGHFMHREHPDDFAARL